MAKEQPTSLAEEAAARKLEERRPTKPISASGLKKVQHVHHNKAEIKKLEAENALAKVDILREMDNKGVDVLTRQGVEIVSRDPFNEDAYDFDMEAFKRDHPKMWKKYSKKKEPGKRINWKSLFGL